MEPTTHADVIEVEVERESQLDATHADLHVSVQGSSLVTGQAALSRARELGQLVQQLKGVGIPETEVSLEGVRAGVSGGLLGKTSSATYRLRIHVPRLELLPDALEAVTTQKNVKLDSITWRYPDAPDVDFPALRQCIREAAERARVIAESLGVSLLGVHRFRQQTRDGERGFYSAGDLGGEVKRRSLSAELGVELGHSKRVFTQVTVAFRVGPLAQTAVS